MTTKTTTITMGIIIIRETTTIIILAIGTIPEIDILGIVGEIIPERRVTEAETTAEVEIGAETEAIRWRAELAGIVEMHLLIMTGIIGKGEIQAKRETVKNRETLLMEKSKYVSTGKMVNAR